MADLSLDDYIRKEPKFKGNTKGQNQGQAGGQKKFVRQSITVTAPNQKFKLNRQYGQQSKPTSLSIKRRLGQHPKPGLAGRVLVQDARQKLTTQRKVPDAREKLLAKTKFVDARVRIENKKAQQQLSQQQQQPLNQQPRQQNKGMDARVRIQNAQAKKQDARQRIRARQGLKQGQNSGQEQPQQVIVTDQGRFMSHTGVVAAGGNLLKVVKSNELAMDNVNGSQTLNYYQTEPSGVISISRPDQHQTSAIMHAQRQPSHIPPHLNQGGAIIQIRNDMYQEPQPVAYQPPQHVYTAPQPAYQMYDEEPEYQQVYQQPTMIVAQPQPTRRAAKPAVKTRTKVVPVKARVTKPKPVHAPLRSRATAVAEEMAMDTASSIQGYKVMVTNLHAVVTQEDVVELFGAMGALKKARLIKPGTAEVVFVKKEDALTAVRKYHLRELDGQPMNVILISSGSASREPAVMKRLAPAPSPTSAPAPVARAPVTAPAARTPVTAPSATPETHQPLRLGKSSPKPTKKSGGSGTGSTSSIDASVLHKALFKTMSKDEPRPAPVTFTVKI